MKTSFFQDRKWILSENPYATEVNRIEQFHEQGNQG